MQSNPLMSQAQAKFDMWFSVAEPTQYHIQGELAESGHADSTPWFASTTSRGT